MNFDLGNAGVNLGAYLAAPTVELDAKGSIVFLDQIRT